MNINVPSDMSRTKNETGNKNVYWITFIRWTLSMVMKHVNPALKKWKKTNGNWSNDYMRVSWVTPTQITQPTLSNLDDEQQILR